MRPPAGYRVAGKYLIVVKHAVLPLRCVFCNRADAVPQGLITKRLSYIVPAIEWLGLLNLLFVPFGYLFARTPVTLSYYMCHLHRRQARLRWIGIVIALGLCTLGIIGATIFELLAFGLLTGIGVLSGFVLLSRRSKALIPCKHEHGEFWIQGCGNVFLDSLAQDNAIAD